MFIINFTMKKEGLIGWVTEISRIWTLERPTIHAAALAYYSMFAFAPIIYISLTIAGIFVDQLTLVNQLFEKISSYLGPEITSYIRETVSNLIKSNSTYPVIATIVSVFAILYAASGLFYQLQYSLNTIWRIPPPERELGRFLLKQRLVSLLMVAASGLLIIVALMVFAILAWLESRIKLGNNLAIANPLAAWALISLSFSLIYKFTPQIKVRWKEVLPGAAIAGFFITLILLLLSLFFRLGSFNTAFTATGAVVMVLVGMNMFANIFLLGAVIGRSIHTRYLPTSAKELTTEP